MTYEGLIIIVVFILLIVLVNILNKWSIKNVNNKIKAVTDITMKITYLNLFDNQIKGQITKSSNQIPVLIPTDNYKYKLDKVGLWLSEPIESVGTEKKLYNFRAYLPNCHSRCTFELVDKSENKPEKSL